MKKVIVIISLTALIYSCNKNENKETDEPKCPVISKELVPSPVKQSFAIKYPTDTVITWFDKMGSGYCAYFIQPVNIKKTAEFSTTGTFLKEKSGKDKDHDGKFDDSTSTDIDKSPAVCECEIDH